MLQLPAIIVLTVSIFVGRVCPVQHEEGHNSSTVEHPTEAKYASNIQTNRSNVEVGSPGVLANNEGGKTSKSKEDAAVATHLPIVNETTTTLVQNGTGRERHNCNSTKEVDDMRGCYVTPHDDDEVENQTPSLNATKPVTPPKSVANESVTEKTEESSTKVILFGNNRTNESTTVDTGTSSINQTFYVTVPSDVDHSVNANVTDPPNTDPKLGINNTEVSSVVPLLVNNVRNIESESISGEAKSEEMNSGKSMPSGIIALVTAIVFAIAVVIAYITLIAWRRYVEYRYGHRELLVNDLEFDTNDLRHFEL